MSQIVKLRILDLNHRAVSSSHPVRIPLGVELRRIVETIIPNPTDATLVFFCSSTDRSIDQLHQHDFDAFPQRRFLHVLCVLGMTGEQDTLGVLTALETYQCPETDKVAIRQFLLGDDIHHFETPFQSVRITPILIPPDESSRPGTKLLEVKVAGENCFSVLTHDGKTLRELIIQIPDSPGPHRNDPSCSGTTCERSEGKSVINTRISAHVIPLFRDIAWKEEALPVKEIIQAVVTPSGLHCLHDPLMSPGQPEELKTFRRTVLANGDPVYRDTGNRILPIALPASYPWLMMQLRLEEDHFSDGLVRSQAILGDITGELCAITCSGHNDFSLLEWIAEDSVGRIHRFRYGKESDTPFGFPCEKKPHAFEWLEQCGVYLVAMPNGLFLIDPLCPDQEPIDISSCFGQDIKGGEIESFSLARRGLEAAENNLLIACRPTKIEAYWLENVF